MVKAESHLKKYIEISLFRSFSEIERDELE